MSGHRQLAMLTILFAAVVAVRGAAPPEALHEEIKRLMIDVRDALAYTGGRIPGAIHVPLLDIDRRAAEVIKQAKGRTIVTYCSCPAEHSSAEAGWVLMKHGARDSASHQARSTCRPASSPVSCITRSAKAVLCSCTKLLFNSASACGATVDTFRWLLGCVVSAKSIVVISGSNSDRLVII